MAHLFRSVTRYCLLHRLAYCTIPGCGWLAWIYCLSGRYTLYVVWSPVLPITVMCLIGLNVRELYLLVLQEVLASLSHWPCIFARISEICRETTRSLTIPFTLVTVCESRSELLLVSIETRNITIKNRIWLFYGWENRLRCMWFTRF